MAINHYPMYSHERPSGEPELKLPVDSVMNAQGRLVCPSCQTENHTHSSNGDQDSMTALCRGCGMQFRREFTVYSFWPSFIPKEEQSPEPKTNIEKIIDDITTLQKIAEDDPNHDGRWDHMRKRALVSFEKRLRQLIREEVNGPAPERGLAKLGKRLLDMPKTAAHPRQGGPDTPT